MQDTSTPAAPVEILPYPGSLISAGARGETVMALQEYLNEISLVYPEITPITPTGNYGTNTTAAVMAFQRLFNLPDTGVVDRDTFEEIERVFAQVREGAQPAFGQFPGYDLKEGQVDRVRGIETNTDNLVGRPVYSLQQMLRYINAEKPLPGIPDGIFGSQTTDRVKTFQTENNINPTGTVDSATFRAIRDAYNAKTDALKKPQSAAPHGVSFDNPETEADILYVAQTMLNKLADTYENITRPDINGLYDAKTQKAISDFQTAFNLPQNEFDKNTWDTLTKIYNEIKS